MQTSRSEPLQPALLASKLKAPVLKSGIVRRERLTDHLQASLEQPVTLVVAPTGYGKTTLLVEWLSTNLANNCHTVWLNLDPSDNDPSTIWSYVIAGIEQVCPQFHISHELLRADRVDNGTFVYFNPILNAIAQIPFRVCLILDDYQAIGEPQVHRGLSYLIEHQPENLHLILSSRVVPPIPLTRLRAQRRLAVITEKDLAFNLKESRQFITNILGLSASSDQVTALIHATEGWAAGLLLCGAALKEQNPVVKPLAYPIPGKEIIATYLFEEVLDLQEPEVREFLLETSILPELSAPLCDAIRGSTTSKELLEKIEASNVFIIPLDPGHTWYRYHTLFAEALENHLQRSQPDLCAELHRRACRWLRENGYPYQAIDHALSGKDLETAAELIEGCARETFIRMDIHSLVRWIDHFPEPMLAKYPHLGIYHALANTLMRQAYLVEPKLSIVEKALSKPELIHLSADDLARFRWEMSVIRALVKRNPNEVEISIAQFQELIQAAPEEENFFKGILAHALANIFLLGNDLDKAAAELEYECQLVDEIDFHLGRIQSGWRLAHTRKLQGRLDEAEAEYHRCLDLAIQENMDAGAVAMSQVSLMDIALERNDIEGVDVHLRNVLNHFDQIEKSDIRWDFLALLNVRLANYYLKNNDLPNAHLVLQLATEAYEKYNKPGSDLPIEYIEVQAHLSMAEGDLQAVENWLRKRITQFHSVGKAGLGELAALARLLSIAGEQERALQVAGDLEKLARPIGMHELVIKALVYQAAAYQALGNQPQAFEALEKAIELAAPQRYIRVFVEEGQPMKSLLTAYLGQSPAITAGETGKQYSYYLQEVMAAIEGSGRPGFFVSGSTGSKNRLVIPLLQPLSDRELEVYKLMAAGKSTKEVAVELKISINTAKTHARSIFKKFGAHSWKEVIQNTHAVKELL